MSAILGASGSGKTTLLNILAGRLFTGGKISVSGNIKLDGRVVDPQKDIRYMKQIAYVPEDDYSLPKASTPREAIRFSAKLRLSRDTTNETIENLVEKLIQELDLKECADTVAGGFLLKGISKGERRRLLVGIQLVVRPTFILLDEPTSGTRKNDLVFCSALLQQPSLKLHFFAVLIRLGLLSRHETH